MKIKQKKQLTLPQLIEHIAQNNYEECVYQADNAPVYVRVGRIKGIHIEGGRTVFPHNTFTVITEEEITLTTPLPAMLHVWKTGILGAEIMEVENKSIASQYTICSTEFWLKEDNEMTLIWKNGKLVE